MKSTVLLLFTLIVFLLSACDAGNKPDSPSKVEIDSNSQFKHGTKHVVTSAPESETEHSSEADQAHEKNSSEQLSELFIRLPYISFRDEASFALQGIAADYVQMDYETFLETHDRFMLYQEGIIDAASYIIGGTRFENMIGGSTLVFSTSHQRPVAGELGIGTPVSAILAQFGEPDFVRQQDELIGYKTKTFYIAFTGKEIIERIYLSRRYPQEEQDEILSDDRRSSPKNSFNMMATHLARGSTTYYRSDGLCIWDTPTSLSTVIYKDYTGLIPEGASEETGFFFRDADYPEYKIYKAIDEEKAFQEELADELEPGFYSPDKRIAILPFTDCTYERSGFLFRYLDGSNPDRFVSFGHFPYDPVWLNERYLCVITMYGFGIYDLSGDVDSVFRIGDESLGRLKIVEPVQQPKTLTLRGENIIVIAGDTRTEMQLNDKEQLLLQFQFSSDGTLLVEYSVVNR